MDKNRSRGIIEAAAIYCCIIQELIQISNLHASSQLHAEALDMQDLTLMSGDFVWLAFC